MLRPWNNTALLYVAPRYVSVRRAHADKSEPSVTVPLVEDFQSEGAQHEALSASIQDALAQLAATAGHPIRHVHVEIDDAFAFYDIFATDARTMSEAELQRIARLALADTLGLDHALLDSRCAVQRGGRSVVTCAMPNGLVAAIDGAIRLAGGKPGRIEAAFAAFLNRHRETLSDGDAIVARLAGDHLTLGLLGSGNWQALSTERVSENSWRDLHARCDAFGQRLCVGDPERLPVWFEADVQDIPDGAGARWHRFGSAAE